MTRLGDSNQRSRWRRWLGHRLAHIAVLIYALADLVAGEDTLADYIHEGERETVAAA